LKKAVFLDRDGVIIFERGEYNYLPVHMRINQGVTEALSQLQSLGYMLIIISNQGGVSKGMYLNEDVEDFHKLMIESLKESGICIDEIYFCPHHPDVEMCICRKPDSLLIEKALARFDIDPSLSYFIGDAARDMLSASKTGVKEIKIESNEDLKNILHFFTN
jgi:D-glycero-D-manno-heptose 1,7-bisphosphate phosphatase